MANTLSAALSRLVRSHCDSKFLCGIVEWRGNFSEVTWPSLYPLPSGTRSFRVMQLIEAEMPCYPTNNGRCVNYSRVLSKQPLCANW
jgi:hypothetical protein